VKSQSVTIKIARIDPEKTDIPLPSYATEGASGMDIHAAVASDVKIDAGETVLIPTGFVLEIPRGYEAQIRPRSGLAIKHSVGILNSPGTIDSDYRGEVKIIVTNFGKQPFVVHRGDRIAQMVISAVTHISWDERTNVEQTSRGAGGFGHTGR